jgi:hypothetical protein
MVSITERQRTGGAQEPRLRQRQPSRDGKRLAIAAIILVLGLIGGGFGLWDRRGPQAPTEIFAGVVYGTIKLNETPEGRGLVHWLRIDLTAPGIELYVPALDPMATAQGWQYRLRRIGEVVGKEHLAVAINGTYFTSEDRWLLRMSGDLANSVETVVANHVVSHLWEHNYLLSFDEQLTPSLSRAKPPTPAELAQAKWGIGGQAVWLWDGKVWPGSDRRPDSRTAVAIDRPRKLLFMAVGQYVSPRRLLQELADLGAKDGMLLDGGGSSSMAIGNGAIGVAAGTVYGGWRPVATYFGVRARPIPVVK